jgi:hypothetical protein
MALPYLCACQSYFNPSLPPSPLAYPQLSWVSRCVSIWRRVCSLPLTLSGPFVYYICCTATDQVWRLCLLMLVPCWVSVVGIASRPTGGPLSLLINWYLGYFPRGWSGLGVKLAAHFHIVPKWRMRGAVRPLPIWPNYVKCLGLSV